MSHDPCPHGPDDPCTCDGCAFCDGHVVGCTCDIDWDALREAELNAADQRDYSAFIIEHVATCDQIVALCRPCSDHFGLVPVTKES